MAKLIITREKSMVGMIAPMNCYVNNSVICKIKNGEKTVCEVENTIISFKCNLGNNPMSDMVYLDLSDGKTVRIKVKQGALKPSVNIIDKDAITHCAPSQTISPESSNVHGNPQELRTALRTFKSTVDIQQAFARKQTPEAPFSFTSTREVGNYFAIDENSRIFAIGKGTFPSLKKAIYYNYDDVIDFELLEDGGSVVKGGIGRAVVGGMLFGGVGAVIGGATGKKKVKQTCTSLMIKITVNSTANPVEYIKLISSSTSKDSLIYKTAFHDAQEILSYLQLICSHRSNNSTLNNSKAVHQTSPADEIKKYKALMDEGIISEEEFQAKKRQLLGI